jgi:hypothetical protein
MFAATADLLQRTYFEPSEITDQIQTLRNRAQDAFDWRAIGDESGHWEQTLPMCDG